MNFSGGFADVRGNVANTGSIITTGNGVTTFFNNLVHNGSEVRTAPGSVTAIFGLASGTGNFTGTGLVRFEGGYSPGNSPGHVNFAGDVLFGGTSNLELELGGFNRGTEYDAIDIAGAVTINSDIIVRSLNGFIPLPGHRFDVMTFGSMIGEPEILNGTEFTGLWFDVARDADSLSLLPNAMGGDATLDGIVNIGDFALLASRFNMTGQTWLGGDFTGDGLVNISDFAVLGANFNQTAPQQRLAPLGTPTSVPEPSVGALLLAAGLLARRRVSCPTHGQTNEYAA